MTIDIEFLLARHPSLFLGWECQVKGFDSSGVLTAICGGGRNIHPFPSVDRLIRSASVNDNSNKTPEEIEAEEEARRNGEGFGALVGAGVLVYDYLTSQSEPQDTAEDEDVGFTQSM